MYKVIAVYTGQCWYDVHFICIRAFYQNIFNTINKPPLTPLLKIKQSQVTFQVDKLLPDYLLKECSIGEGDLMVVHVYTQGTEQQVVNSNR